MEWLDDELREWAGGVGGGSGPPPILLDWCLSVGLDGCKPELFNKEASTSKAYFVGRERDTSPLQLPILSFRGCGRFLCFLNSRVPVMLSRGDGEGEM